MESMDGIEDWNSVPLEGFDHERESFKTSGSGEHGPS
jgi:hypothetical protein